MALIKHHLRVDLFINVLLGAGDPRGHLVIRFESFSPLFAVESVHPLSITHSNKKTQSSVCVRLHQWTGTAF